LYLLGLDFERLSSRFPFTSLAAISGVKTRSSNLSKAWSMIFISNLQFVIQFVNIFVKGLKKSHSIYYTRFFRASEHLLKQNFTTIQKKPASKMQAQFFLE
jgi:hypothetical protein